MTCKFCKSEIAADALKCPNCAEWQNAEVRAKHERASQTPESLRAKEKKAVDGISSLVAVIVFALFLWWIFNPAFSPPDISSVTNSLQ